ncbi:SR-related and CTD-associated factor 4 [Scaptodrosophila lebanonensis]|uniref:SR-related and CTD-associated factor 4 n=1 Tax=Drosophila lebanonensis TaxID=7225 RepID=A0A6J2UCT5_DROLE|nr:SR-related and CTD-associated factor 4 [Scaptodrosophila lebanonensis]
MHKLSLVLAAVLLCFVFATAQVVPNSEIGRVAVQVPLLSNGKPLITDDHVEIARVVEITPSKGIEEVVAPPTVTVPLMKESALVRNKRAITMNRGIPNHGIPNPGIPNHGIPNRGIPNHGIPNRGIPNHGIPNPGIPNHGIPNRGIPNHGIPNPGIPNHGIPNPGIPNHGIPNRGIPNHGIPNPGIPNHGIPNRGIPNHAASELMPVAVLPPTTIPTPTIVPKRGPSKTCHQLLLADMTTTPSPMMMESKPAENCDILCTKHDFVPICAHNGICTHEFANQCVLDTYNCKNRDLAFRVVDEDVCRLGLCARRCNEDDLKV